MKNIIKAPNIMMPNEKVDMTNKGVRLCCFAKSTQELVCFAPIYC